MTAPLTPMQAVALHAPDLSRCGAQISMLSRRVPSWLIQHIDGHIQPSSRPHSVLRVHCEHLDWEVIAEDNPALFQPGDVGAPPLEVLLEARALAAAEGIALALDVEFEIADDRLTLGIYGLAANAALPTSLWQDLAALLTTCTAVITTPFPPRELPAACVHPAGWRRTEDEETRWHYASGLAPGCTCLGHTGQPDFGPRT